MSYNKHTVVGNVGNDPKITNFEHGSIATFCIATTERGYTAKSGQIVPDKTDWHNIVVRGGLVNVVEGWVKKGSQILVSGPVHQRSYDNKEGQKVYITEVYANELTLLGGNKQGDVPNHPAQSNGTKEDAPQNDNLPF